MDIMEAMQRRHSVRAYTDRKIEGAVKEELEQFIAQCNADGNLHMQLILNEPRAFASRLNHYGMFSNVKNYVAIVGKPAPDFDERCGYYGEKVVLKAQQMGLNTCWVGLTYSKHKAEIKLSAGEKVSCVIAIGYGANQGKAHGRSKKLNDVCKTDGAMPEWFRAGVEAALMAPTAVHQQKFSFTLQGDDVIASAGLGFYSKVDLGIVKYHFELGSGRKLWFR